MRSTMTMSGLGEESAMALEHALIMMLLLMELLSGRIERRRTVSWLVLVSVALMLLPPIYAIAMPWPLLSTLILPLLLWQIAMRFATAQSVLTGRTVLIWLLTAVLIGLGAHIAGRWSPMGAVVLGALAACLIWQTQVDTIGNTNLGTLSQLALALLLAEVDLTLHPIRPFLGSLFAGAALGIGLGCLGVRAALRLSTGMARNLFCLGLAYGAYLVGALPGASGVAIATMTALTMAIYGYHVGLWPNTMALSMPLSRPRMVLLLGGALLLLGWQADVSLTRDQATGVGLGLLAAALGTLAGRWLIPVPSAAGRPVFQVLWQTEGRVFLVLLGILLLWPHEAVLGPEAVAVALLAAVVLVVLLHTALKAVFEFLEIELRSPHQIRPVQQRERQTDPIGNECARTRRADDRNCDPGSDMDG